MGRKTLMPDATLLRRWHESEECRAACASALAAIDAAYRAADAAYNAARDNWMQKEVDAACEVPSGEGGEEDA
jgi:hypothetical protein